MKSFKNVFTIGKEPTDTKIMHFVRNDFRKAILRIFIYSKLKIILFLLIILSVSLTAIINKPILKTAPSNSYLVTKDANIRSGPSIHSNIIRIVQSGEILTLFNKTHGYWQLSNNEDEYISSTLVRKFQSKPKINMIYIYIFCTMVLSIIILFILEIRDLKKWILKEKYLVESLICPKCLSFNNFYYEEKVLKRRQFLKNEIQSDKYVTKINETTRSFGYSYNKRWDTVGVSTTETFVKRPVVYNEDLIKITTSCKSCNYTKVRNKIFQYKA